VPCAQHKKPEQDIPSKHNDQLQINPHSGFLVPAAPSFCEARPLVSDEPVVLVGRCPVESRRVHCRAWPHSRRSGVRVRQPRNQGSPRSPELGPIAKCDTNPTVWRPWRLLGMPMPHELGNAAPLTLPHFNCSRADRNSTLFFAARS
jgi:hypothetical protein